MTSFWIFLEGINPQKGPLLLGAKFTKSLHLWFSFWISFFLQILIFVKELKFLYKILKIMTDVKKKRVAKPSPLKKNIAASVCL